MEVLSRQEEKDTVARKNSGDEDKDFDVAAIGLNRTFFRLNLSCIVMFAFPSVLIFA